MTRYPLSAYGPDPKNPWLENSANGWGAYAWPDGVPATLRGTVTTADGTNIHLRKELVPLVGVLAAITEAHGYAMHTASGGNTGGYANRSIRGGDGPSTHSRARAVDIRAHDNPQSWTFTCTIPPAVVAAWEACGFYWGGRYTGVMFDPQHFSYIHTPAGVAADLARARRILADLNHAAESTAAPTTSPDLLEWIMSLPGAPEGLTYRQFLNAVANAVLDTPVTVTSYAMRPPQNRKRTIRTAIIEDYAYGSGAAYNAGQASIAAGKALAELQEGTAS